MSFIHTSLSVRKVALVLLVLFSITKANPNPQRRKHYQTSSSYLDSYQFPNQNQNQPWGEQQQPRQPPSPPRQQYDYVAGNRFGQRYPNTNDRGPLDFDTFGSGDTDDSEYFGRDLYGTGTRFDFEGSGSFTSDDEDDFNPELGSGNYLEITTTPKAPPSVTTPDIFQITTTSKVEDEVEGSGEEDIIEGSGGGCGDDEDDEDCQNPKTNPTIPAITIPSTPPPMTTEDIFFPQEPSTPSTTSSTSTTTKTTSITEKTTTTKITPIPTKPPTTTTTSSSSSTTSTTTDTTIRTTPAPPGTPTTPKYPDLKKVPTPLVENRVVVIIVFITLVLVLVLGILFSLCMLCRYHKRPPSEASSDTASSDLPMLKADAKRPQTFITPAGSSGGHIRRAGSESPPPLPDLPNLFDEPVKFDRKSSGGSIRKSKRDLKKAAASANDSTYSNGNWKNPNWL